ncbi:MAG: hypothetical protein HC809_13785 [Gammaproteobacteria bacterium]|nr:hypothetical protein [Gammaproteobacteria bacterium]
MPGRSLIGEGLDDAVVPFAIAGATLTRNAEVAIRLAFQGGGDALEIGHLVQLRNVP